MEIYNPGYYLFHSYMFCLALWPYICDMYLKIYIKDKHMIPGCNYNHVKVISPLSLSQYSLHLAHLSFTKFPFESTLVAQYGPFPSTGVAHDLYVLPLCLKGNTQS